MTMVEIDSELAFPHSQINRWQLHTGHYLSRIQVHDHGAATVVTLPETKRAYAGQLWIIGRPKAEEADVLYTTGGPGGPHIHLFDYEAVWLRGNDAL